MNKTEMMSIITASNDAEEILNDKRESQFALAKEAKAKLVEEMNNFIREFFPMEIWEVLGKLPNVVNVCYHKEKYASDLLCKVKTNGIGIGFEKDSDWWKLYFAKEDGMEILFRTPNPNSYRFKGFNPSMEVGHTWWKHLAWCSSISETEDDIKSIREYTQMLDEIKLSIGEIYEEIAKENAKRLSDKANKIANNDINLGTETKKRVITITIEEV